MPAADVVAAAAVLHRKATAIVSATRIIATVLYQFVIAVGSAKRQNLPRKLLPSASLSAVEAVTAGGGGGMVAWLWWILKGRPYIRVEMSSDWMQAAGFPCPEVEHFHAPAYKYAKVMRALQARAMRELERRAFESPPPSEGAVGAKNQP